MDYRPIRSLYSVGRMPPAWLTIIDEGGDRSVTNDVENVLEDLAARGEPLDTLRIIYRDSMGCWDGIATRDGRFAGFVPLGGATLAQALILWPADQGPWPERGGATVRQ